MSGVPGQRGIFGLAVFLGAFLLFQVQPMVAKAIAPSFGGSAMVWTTCMVFFQAALLGGYLYAHLTSRLTCRRQAQLHVLLLGIATLTLDLAPTFPVVQDAADPALRLAGQLAVTIGPAFLLISATAPLLQRWFAITFQAAPYRLYSLSNAGSLLGLLSYPFVIEPALSLKDQASLWRIGLILLMLCCAALSRLLPSLDVAPLAAEESSGSSDMARPSLAWYGWWVLLAAAPSALLLAVTSKISVEIAPVPLLWVIPLSLYLLTFIVSFDHDGWYRPGLTFGGALVSIMFAGLWLHQRSPHLLWLTGSLYAALFCCSLLCHGELSGSRPAPRWLTGYFLAISAGGVLGGLLVGLVAPRVFDSYHELPLAFAACILLGTLAQAPRRLPQRSLQWTLATAGALAVAFWISPELHTGLLSTFEIRRGADLEFATILVALGLVLGCVLLWTRPSDRSLAAVFLGGLTALIFPVSLAIATRSMGTAAVTQLGTAGGFLNPLAIWAAGGLIVLILAAWPARRTRSSDDHAGTGRPYGAMVITAMFTAVGTALFTKTLLDLTTASGDFSIALAVPFASFALPRSAAAPRWGIIRVAACLCLLVLTTIPALLLVQGILLPQNPLAAAVLGVATACGCLLVAVTYRADAGEHRRFLGWAMTAAAIGGGFVGLIAPESVARCGMPLVALLSGIAVLSQLTRQDAASRALVAGGLTVVAAGAAFGLVRPGQLSGQLIAADRNFYSLLRVEEVAGLEPSRVLMHGSVSHGSQFLAPHRQAEPTTYYHRQSGAGRLLSLPSARPRRVGIVGLGIGTLAAYGRPGDVYRFFEIDPKVVTLAQTHFDFLKSSAATIDHVVADGRLALANETEPFDILIIDAFTGDSIPTHLLTAEAFEIYERCLSPDGYLALHLSNTHIDLTPVINGQAQRTGWKLQYVDSPASRVHPRSLWAILSKNELPLGSTPLSDAVSDRVVEWTDQSHGLLPLIRWRSAPPPRN